MFLKIKIKQYFRINVYTDIYGYIYIYLHIYIYIYKVYIYIYLCIYILILNQLLMCPSVYELQVATKVAIYNKQCKKQIHIHIYIYIYIYIYI